VCCSVLQCVAVCCSVWQCVAVCCSMLFDGCWLDSFPVAAHWKAHCVQTRLSCCQTLQHTATHSNTLQHTATHCNTLLHWREMNVQPHAVPRKGPLTVTHYNKLQHAATHCNTLQHTATHYNTLQHTATLTQCEYPRHVLCPEKSQSSVHAVVRHVPVDMRALAAVIPGR